MKTQAFVLALLLSVSQAYAWGDREQSALLGFVSGVIVTNLYHHQSAEPIHRDIQILRQQPVINVRPHRHFEREYHPNRFFKTHHPRKYACDFPRRHHKHRDHGWR